MPDERLPLPEDWEIVEDIFVKIAEEIFNRVFKIPGKGLSTEDFTTYLLNKLNEIEERANRTIIEDNFDSLEPGHGLSANKGHELKQLIDGLALLIANLVGGTLNVDTAEKANKLTNARNFSISGHGTAGPNVFDGTQDVDLYLELNDSGVKGGTYTKVTVTDKGIVTSASQQTADDLPMLTLSKISDAYRKEDKANKGVANGYVPLNEMVKIPYQFLSDFILGQKLYAGTFNAITALASLSTLAQDKLGTFDTEITLTNNTAPITGYLVNEGNYYIISVPGTFAGEAFHVGDWLVATADGWKKIDNTDALTGVKGDKETNYRIGNVNLTTTDIGAEPAITPGAVTDYWAGNKTWRNLIADVLATVITTPTLTNDAIATGDSIQTISGKLQAQINNRAPLNTILVDNAGSRTLPTTTSGSLVSKIQALRDNVKSAFAEIDGKFNWAALPSGTNTQNVRTPGMYTCVSWVDVPAGVADTQGTLIVYPYSGGVAGGQGWLYQEFISPHVSTIWKRSLISTTFTSWIEIINADGTQTLTNKTLTGPKINAIYYDAIINFLTNAGSAQGINIGQLLISNTYADVTNVPSSGLYAKGQIRTGVATGTAPFVVSSTTTVTNLSADMVDGLHVHTGRNDQANQIVRTDASGYIQAGWINSQVSGATGQDIAAATIGAFIVENTSRDGYYRKATVANVGSAISTARTFSISIPTNAWVTSSTHTGFTRQAAVTVTGLLATDNVDVILAPASIIIANDAGLMSGGLTTANTVTLYSRTTPTAALSGVVNII